jgi:hypothetical protein
MRNGVTIERDACALLPICRRLAYVEVAPELLDEARTGDETLSFDPDQI